MSDKISIIRKIKALADNIGSSPGERDAAYSMLDKLMSKYNITEEDLDSDKEEYFIFTYHGKDELKILVQVAYKVRDSRDCINYVKRGQRNSKTEIGIKCTKSQKLEIEFLFEFYKNLYYEEKEHMMSAFIQKHRLFGSLKDGEEPEKISNDEYFKLRSYMNSMNDVTPYRAIEENND